MPVLVIWNDAGNGEVKFMPIECTPGMREKLESWHDKYICMAGNTDEMDNEMLEFFYAEREGAHGVLVRDKYRYELFDGPMKGYFDLIVMTGIM